MWSGSRTATGGLKRPAEADAGSPAFLGLGSNVGDRRAHLSHALGQLANIGRITAISSIYETAPVGFVEQGPFLNLVARIDTALAPRALLTAARDIEIARGRERTFRNAPRTLDIDLLLYGDRIVREPGLEIPHPRMSARPFVLVPLVEIEPDLRDPATGARYADLLAGLVHDDPAAAGVVRLGPGTELMTEEQGDG